MVIAIDAGRSVSTSPHIVEPVGVGIREGRRIRQYQQFVSLIADSDALPHESLQCVEPSSGDNVDTPRLNVPARRRA